MILFEVRIIIFDKIICILPINNSGTLRGISMEYLSIKQTAEKWGISGRRIQRLCAEGRISGATKIGSYWAVPVDAQRPKDGRIKSGKYIKAAQK